MPRKLPRFAGHRAHDRGYRTEPYEAVAQALRVFREDDWTETPERAPSTIAVTIKQPQTEHRVRIKDFESWHHAPGKSPAEMTLKNRLRDMLRC